MPVQFDVPETARERVSKKLSIADLKDVFNNPEGKKIIRDSMALKPISKERRRKELERMSVAFGLDDEAVSNLKSCIITRKVTGELDEVKWRNSTELVETFYISKIRASCWDECFYTEVSRRVCVVSTAKSLPCCYFFLDDVFLFCLLLVSRFIFLQDEMAEFKYEAFMEECGLDPTEFE